jgi:hypothetical protein
MDFPVKKSSRCEHNRFRTENQARLGHNAPYPISLDQKVVDRLLEQEKIFLVF